MQEHGTWRWSGLSNAYYLSDLAEATAKIAFIEGNIKTA